MTWKLFLDDERFPPFTAPDHPDYVICRTCEEAIALIREKGMPNFITFDHDLGDTPYTGSYLASWIIESDLDGVLEIPSDFSFNVHSMNPVGAQNIKMKMDRYLKCKKDYSDEAP